MKDDRVWLKLTTLTIATPSRLLFIECCSATAKAMRMIAKQATTTSSTKFNQFFKHKADRMVVAQGRAVQSFVQGRTSFIWMHVWSAPHPGSRWDAYRAGIWLRGRVAALAESPMGVQFLDSRSWILYLMLAGHFVLESSFLSIVLTACKKVCSLMFCSWKSCFLSSFLDIILLLLARHFVLRDVLFLDPCSWVLVPPPRSWNSRPLHGRHLLVLVAGYGTSYFKSFLWESLCGGVLGVKDIPFKRGRRGLATGGWQENLPCSIFLGKRERVE